MSFTRTLFLFFVGLMAASGLGLISVQAAETDYAYNPRHSYDFGLYGGTLLPNSIIGVTELVPGWGFLAAVPTGKGVFEVATFIGSGNSETYDTAAFDYRYDIPFSTLETHFLGGINVDTYTSPTMKKSFIGGWHFGGGAALQLAGPIFLRSDFRYRIGPGVSLIVTVGLDYRLSDSTSGSN